ncbi:MAG: hypothetical protein MK132_16165 [Lentisphaerales bacterium]|nr:hypothetical protein [Lentisphaerales bacterium]
MRIMNSSDFTLFELIVVVSIMVILLTLLLPSLCKAKELSLSAICLSNTALLHKNSFVYRTKNNRLMLDRWSWEDEFEKYGESVRKPNFLSKRQVSWFRKWLPQLWQKPLPSSIQNYVICRYFGNPNRNCIYVDGHDELVRWPDTINQSNAAYLYRPEWLR